MNRIRMCESYHFSKPCSGCLPESASLLARSADPIWTKLHCFARWSIGRNYLGNEAWGPFAAGDPLSLCVNVLFFICQPYVNEQRWIMASQLSSPFFCTSVLFARTSLRLNSYGAWEAALSLAQTINSAMNLPALERARQAPYIVVYLQECKFSALHSSLGTLSMRNPTRTAFTSIARSWERNGSRS
jgi:hypothetical protein